MRHLKGPMKGLEILVSVAGHTTATETKSRKAALKKLRKAEAKRLREQEERARRERVAARIKQDRAAMVAAHWGIPKEAVEEWGL